MHRPGPRLGLDAPADVAGGSVATPLHGLADPARERWATVANQVTMVRTVLAVAVALWAISAGSVGLIAIGYAVYWAGDVLDGFLARRLDQETRIGAVADIVCDRICTGLLGAALVATLPWTAVPVLIFLVQFAVVDLGLSLSFLRWPILSPNYFFLVDRRVYTLNWSPVAKAANTASVVLVTALTGSAWAGGIVAALGLGLKVCCLWRVRRLVAERLR